MTRQESQQLSHIAELLNGISDRMIVLERADAARHERDIRTEEALAEIRDRSMQRDAEMMALRSGFKDLAASFSTMQPEVRAMRRALVTGKVLGRTGKFIARVVMGAMAFATALLSLWALLPKK